MDPDRILIWALSIGATAWAVCSVALVLGLLYGMASILREARSIKPAKEEDTPEEDRKPWRLADAKIDQREPRGFWAPGNYYQECTTCGHPFIGDKRAVQCADCAYLPVINEPRD